MSGFQARSIFQNAYRSDIIRVVLMCSGLFVLLWFIEITFLMTKDGTAFFFQYFKNPLLLPIGSNDYLQQPWSIFTYGFLDSNFWALFTNMIWLWIFGSILEDLKGTNRVFPIFWIGFIFAGIILLLVNSFWGQSSTLYASTLGGVAAVAAAAITFRPKTIFYSIFNKGIPIYVFGLMFVGIMIYINWQDYKAATLFLAGSLLGYLSQTILHGFFEKVRNVFANTRSYFSNNENFMKNKSARKTVKLNTANRQLKEIVTKLNAEGLESLSKEEIEILKFHNKL